MRNAKNVNAKNTSKYKDFMNQASVIFEGGGIIYVSFICLRVLILSSKVASV